MLINHEYTAKNFYFTSVQALAENGDLTIWSQNQLKNLEFVIRYFPNKNNDENLNRRFSGTFSLNFKTGLYLTLNGFVYKLAADNSGKLNLSICREMTVTYPLQNDTYTLLSYLLGNGILNFDFQHDNSELFIEFQQGSQLVFRSREGYITLTAQV